MDPLRCRLWPSMTDAMQWSGGGAVADSTPASGVFACAGVVAGHCVAGSRTLRIAQCVGRLGIGGLRFVGGGSKEDALASRLPKNSAVAKPARRCGVPGRSSVHVWPTLGRWCVTCVSLRTGVCTACAPRCPRKVAGERAMRVPRATREQGA